MLLLNLGVIAWLFLCYIASFISPLEINYLTLFSLTTPFAILSNFVFVALWLFATRKWRALFSILALLCCYKMISPVLGLNFFASNDWSDSGNSFKLMSWNVHAMGTFSPRQENATASGIVDLIRSEEPDLLCLPEYAMNKDATKRVHTPRIIRSGSYKRFYFNKDNDYGPSIDIGTAFFSKFPILNATSHRLNTYISMTQCDVQPAPGKIIRVFCVHLHSFGLSDQDKAVIEEVKQRNTDGISTKSRSFAYKFNQAYKERAAEADRARALIAKSPYPVIVCGDFNDLPFSYTYRTIRADLSDAFAEKGKGFGRTYNQIIPTLRIDHILFSPSGVKLNAFKTLRTHLSDHNPVVASFSVK